MSEKRAVGCRSGQRQQGKKLCRISSGKDGNKLERQAQKEVLYADYGKLKKQVKEYDVIKQNIDSILRLEKEPEQDKGKERE